MLFTTRKSKKFAEEVARALDGRLEKCHLTLGLRTCRYCVKFKYRGLRVHAYFFYPSCELWVQNFSYPDNFSLCLPAPLPSLVHTIPLNDSANNYSVPIFIDPNTHENVVRSFLQTPIKKVDFKKLLFAKKEHLIINSEQLIFRGRINTISLLTERLELLCQIFETSAMASQSKTPKKIDPLEVPEHLRDLIPMAERWGIGDDVLRQEIWDEATPEEKEDLKAGLQGRTKEISDWLDELERTASDSGAAAYFMYLLEGLDESGLWPD
jgi:hypothetical protein